MVVLASSLREPLLQVGGPARLHDTGRDGRLPEPEGALTRRYICVDLCSRPLFTVLTRCPAPSPSKQWRRWPAAAVSTVC